MKGVEPRKGTSLIHFKETSRGSYYTRGHDVSSGPEMKPKGGMTIVSGVSPRASGSVAVRREVLKQ